MKKITTLTLIILLGIVSCSPIKQDRHQSGTYTAVNSGCGYISRKSAGEVETYKGRFGEGYIILRPRFDTTNYIYVEYYIAD